MCDTAGITGGYRAERCACWQSSVTDQEAVLGPTCHDKVQIAAASYQAFSRLAVGQVNRNSSSAGSLICSDRTGRGFYRQPHSSYSSYTGSARELMHLLIAKPICFRQAREIGIHFMPHITAPEVPILGFSPASSQPNSFSILFLSSLPLLTIK